MERGRATGPILGNYDEIPSEISLTTLNSSGASKQYMGPLGSINTANNFHSFLPFFYPLGYNTTIITNKHSLFFCPNNIFKGKVSKKRSE